VKPDPIVEEVRAARLAIFAEFDFDLDRFVEWMRRRDREAGDRVTLAELDEMRSGHRPS
jgi:hypothetical protein